MDSRILSFKAFDGTPQIIVQRCQIAASRWPNNISTAADNAIFKNRAHNIECSFGCVAPSAVLLKPNVANILFFNFCEQKLDNFACLYICQDQNELHLKRYFFFAKIGIFCKSICRKHYTATFQLRKNKMNYLSNQI